jgi:regulator of sigma E protease
VQSILADLAIPKGATSATAKITYTRPGVEKPAKTEMKLDADQLADVRSVRYKNYLALAEFTKARKTSSPLQAAGWGITETRDFILQFYLTLRRMADRSISPSNMMGPVGIFIGGKAFAYKGIDWLLWFLSMISANLAVVNFLPIPVVDGGQFMFLIFEKIKGRPLSAKAMAIAQYAGLAFLAAVVLFVTYNDIFRYV